MAGSTTNAPVCPSTLSLCRRRAACPPGVCVLPESGRVRGRCQVRLEAGGAQLRHTAWGVVRPHRGRTTCTRCALGGTTAGRDAAGVRTCTSAARSVMTSRADACGGAPEEIVWRQYRWCAHCSTQHSGHHTRKERTALAGPREQMSAHWWRTWKVRSLAASA